MSDLVNAVSQLSQLVDTSSRLHIRVVARTNGSHAGGLIPSVALCAVLKVRVWPAGAIDADVAGGGNVWASVWLGHDCHNCNA